MKASSIFKASIASLLLVTGAASAQTHQLQVSELPGREVNVALGDIVRVDANDLQNLYHVSREAYESCDTSLLNEYTFLTTVNGQFGLTATITIAQNSQSLPSVFDYTPGETVYTVISNSNNNLTSNCHDGNKFKLNILASQIGRAHV